MERITDDKMKVGNAWVDKNEMKNAPLHQFFIEELKGIYYTEHQLVEALETLQKSTTTQVLKKVFEDHRLQTLTHISRLEEIFLLMEETPEQQKCEAIDALVKDTHKVIKFTKEGSLTRDAALIMSAQKAEHYEIASYGGLVQLAVTMAHTRVIDILKTTLKEEKDTDYNLSQIAEVSINFDAEQE